MRASTEVRFFVCGMAIVNDNNENYFFSIFSSLKHRNFTKPVLNLIEIFSVKLHLLNNVFLGCSMSPYCIS